MAMGRRTAEAEMWAASGGPEGVGEGGVCMPRPVGPHAYLSVAEIGSCLKKQTYGSPWSSCQLEMRPFPIKIQIPHVSWGKRFDSSWVAWQQLAADRQEPAYVGVLGLAQTVHQPHSRHQCGLSGHCHRQTLDTSSGPHSHAGSWIRSFLPIGPPGSPFCA